MQKHCAVIFIILFRWLIPVSAQAQDGKENVFLHPQKFYEKFFPHLKLKKIPVDSTYLKTYPNYLSVATHLLFPKVYIDMDPTGMKAQGKNASSQFRTNVNTILGFSASYRFVTAGFAVALKARPGDTEGYGPTKYRTATIKYNNPRYALQFKFIKVAGLTDINTANNLDSTRKYVVRNDITMKEYQFEGIYNFGWKKYSYIAPIDFTLRQVKSRMGFLVKAGVYNNQIFCDTNLLSARQQLYFEHFDHVNRINSYSVKLAPGLGGNLVMLRRFYLSLSVFTPYNLYFIRMFNDKKLERKETSLQLVLDGTASIGYQSKWIYAGIRYQAETKNGKLQYFSTTTVYSYIGFDVGYRFRPPRLVKKVYKETMPPGL